jgi:VanZ family protein
MRQLQAHGLAILATFLVASADEYHQSFLPNRTGQFSDVLLDSCGAVALGLALFLIMHAVEGRRHARSRDVCRIEPAYSGAVA